MPTPLPKPVVEKPATEAQQALAKLRERQAQHEVKETNTSTEVQQVVAQLRQRQAEQEQQEAQQRLAQLRQRLTDRTAEPP